MIPFHTIKGPLKTKRVICLYGGPGAGKSTVCAGLFYHLKMNGYNAEMNREYVKDWAWEKRQIKQGDQSYFFAKQSRKERLYINNELDFIVTDSPLILTHFYGLKYDTYEQKYNTSLMMLKNHHEFCIENGYKVDHFFVKRAKNYNPSGRFQDEDTAKQYDGEIKKFLDDLGIKYNTVRADGTAVETIVNYLETREVKHA